VRSNPNKNILIFSLLAALCAVGALRKPLLPIDSEAQGVRYTMKGTTVGILRSRLVRTLGEPEQINFECGDAVREFRYPGSLRAYLTTRGEVVMLVGGELEVNGRTVHREGDSIQTLLQALGEPNYSTGNNEGSGFARYRDAASCLEIYWWDGRVGSLTLSDRSWREQGYESEGRSLMYDKRRGTIYLAQPRDTKGCYWTPNGWESYGPGC